MEVLGEAAGHVKRVGKTALDWLFSDDDQSFLQRFDRDNGTNVSELHARIKQRTADTAASVNAAGAAIAAHGQALERRAPPCEWCGGSGSVVEKTGDKFERIACPKCACPTCGGKGRLGAAGHEIQCPKCAGSGKGSAP
jgi:DnaJ-class molecular chaperone